MVLSLLACLQQVIQVAAWGPVAPFNFRRTAAPPPRMVPPEHSATLDLNNHNNVSGFQSASDTIDDVTASFLAQEMDTDAFLSAIDEQLKELDDIQSSAAPPLSSVLNELPKIRIDHSKVQQAVALAREKASAMVKGISSAALESVELAMYKSATSLTEKREAFLAETLPEKRDAILGAINSKQAHKSQPSSPSPSSSSSPPKQTNKVQSSSSSIPSKQINKLESHASSPPQVQISDTQIHQAVSVAKEGATALIKGISIVAVESVELASNQAAERRVPQKEDHDQALDQLARGAKGMWKLCGVLGGFVAELATENMTSSTVSYSSFSTVEEPLVSEQENKKLQRLRSFY